MSTSTAIVKASSAKEIENKAIAIVQATKCTPTDSQYTAAIRTAKTYLSMGYSLDKAVSETKLCIDSYREDAADEVLAAQNFFKPAVLRIKASWKRIAELEEEMKNADLGDESELEWMQYEAVVERCEKGIEVEKESMRREREIIKTAMDAIGGALDGL